MRGSWHSTRLAQPQRQPHRVHREGHALDRRLAVEVDEATAVNAEIGFVLVCLRLQLLAAATELCLAINTDPYAVDLARVTDLVTSYKMAISDAVDATAKAKARAKVA